MKEMKKNRNKVKKQDKYIKEIPKERHYNGLQKTKII